MELSYFKEYLILKGKSQTTQDSLLKVVRRFKAWLAQEGMTEDQVNQSDILGYVQTLQVKQNTVQQYLNALNHYFTFLSLETQVITENPIKSIQIKGVKKRELHDLFTEEDLNHIYQAYPSETAVERRNKVILSLMIYQGLSTEDLARLEPKDLQLRAGKLEIRGSRRSQSRTLGLKPFQIIDLQDYIYTTRNEILKEANKESQKLFVSYGSSDGFSNVKQKLMKELRVRYSRVKSAKQIRASVITNWLKKYNLRKVQYLSGHKYVSSTEKYQVGNLEGLQEEISKFHPVS